MTEQILTIVGLLLIMVIQYLRGKIVNGNKIAAVKKDSDVKIGLVVTGFNKENRRRDNRQDFIWNKMRTNLMDRREITNDPEEVAFLSKEINTMIELGD